MHFFLPLVMKEGVGGLVGGDNRIEKYQRDHQKSSLGD